MDFNLRITVDAPAGWKRRVLLYVGLPFALVGATAAVASATIDTSWIQTGQQLSSDKLRTALADAEMRLVALEVVHVAGGTVNSNLDGVANVYPSGWLSIAMKNGEGDVTLSISPGVFSATPSCVVTGAAGNAALAGVETKISTDNPPSTSTLRVTTANTTGSIGSFGFNVVCVGPK